MYTPISPHRMYSLPPYPAHPDSREASAFALVSRIMLIAIAAAIAAVMIVAAPPTVTIPLASVLAAGVLATLVVGRIDRSMSGLGRQDRTELRRRSRASQRGMEGIPRWGAVGVMSIVLLLFALVASEGLRVVLASAGLLGLVGFRLAAADAGWARRGSPPLRHRTSNKDRIISTETP